MIHGEMQAMSIIWRKEEYYAIVNTDYYSVNQEQKLELQLGQR